MKRLITATVIAALIAAPLVPAGAKKKAKKPKPVVVMKDDSGDAGTADAGALPGASEAGFDLVKGTIGQKGKDILFTAEHAAMPETGPPGEFFRLIWGLNVDGRIYEVTVKSLDVGEPDVVATVMGQSPNGAERLGQVYQGVARLEECGTISLGITWSQCTAIGYYDAVFDPAKKTASWAIDMKTLKVKKKSKIAGGGNRVDTGCMICWVPQYQERSLTPNSIIDAAIQSKIYKVK